MFLHSRRRPAPARARLALGRLARAHSLRPRRTDPRRLVLQPRPASRRPACDRPAFRHRGNLEPCRRDGRLLSFRGGARPRLECGEPRPSRPDVRGGGRRLDPHGGRHDDAARLRDQHEGCLRLGLEHAGLPAHRPRTSLPRSRAPPPRLAGEHQARARPPGLGSRACDRGLLHADLDSLARVARAGARLPGHEHPREDGPAGPDNQRRRRPAKGGLPPPGPALEREARQFRPGVGNGRQAPDAARSDFAGGRMRLDLLRGRRPPGARSLSQRWRPVRPERRALPAGNPRECEGPERRADPVCGHRNRAQALGPGPLGNDIDSRKPAYRLRHLRSGGQKRRELRPGGRRVRLPKALRPGRGERTQARAQLRHVDSDRARPGLRPRHGRDRGQCEVRGQQHLHPPRQAGAGGLHAVGRDPAGGQALDAGICPRGRRLHQRAPRPQPPSRAARGGRPARRRAFQ